MAHTIADELTRIKQAKSDIKDTIVMMGGRVDDRATIDKYGEFIKTIPTNLETESITITTNGTTTAPAGKAYTEVITNVPMVHNLQNKTITSNGTYTADGGYDGLGTVTVNIQEDKGDYFYIQDISGQVNTLYLNKTHQQLAIAHLSYSTDKETWTYFDPQSNYVYNLPITTIQPNQKLYLKSDMNHWGEQSMYSYLSTSHQCKVGGNISSMVLGDNYTTEKIKYSNGVATLLSRNSNLIYAHDLILPETDVYGCYMSLFEKCNNLITTPILPVSTPEKCFYRMFAECSSLTSLPELKSSFISTNACDTMFYRCTGITSIPSNYFNKVNDIRDSGFANMFNGCTGLTDVSNVVLPIITRNSAFSAMFADCTNLTKGADILIDKLEYAQCKNMYSNCNLTIAPKITATTLGDYSLESIYQGNSNLTDVTIYATGNYTSDTGQRPLRNWLNGVAANGTIHNLGGATLVSDNVNGIPTGWTEVSS